MSIYYIRLTIQGIVHVLWMEVVWVILCLDNVQVAGGGETVCELMGDNPLVVSLAACQDTEIGRKL